MPKATVDLSEFESLVENRICRLAQHFKDLEAEDRAKLIVALAEPRFSNGVIGRWLLARDLSISKDTINNHRKRQCCCDRSK